MDIEIAQIGNMSQSGSSLLKSIQNNSTPILDLLVRESIQNSLDAARPGRRYVKVEFQIGEFPPKKLNAFLKGSERLLNRRFSQPLAKYLAIRDSETEGLTGKLSSRELTEYESYGNLLKLVYEIGQAQDKKGAGGSWGLGKTVYFRIGIGMVFYYSRIETGRGKYESRLAVTHVEDETVPDKSIIPHDSKGKRRGIAWWGAQDPKDPNRTIPLTDEKEINRILNVFGYEPYKGSETGTSVIIPYIDEKKLLENNRIEYVNNLEQSNNPYWYNSLFEYLVIAIQRWYAPKIDNHDIDRVYLKPIVIDRSAGKAHGERKIQIDSENMEPAFKAVRDLFNLAYFKIRKREYCSELSLYGIDARSEKIQQNNVFVVCERGRISGAVAFASVTRRFLRMGPPNNNYSPYYYYGLPDEGDDSHLPIMSYARKPGMVVQYTDTGKWVHGVPAQTDDTYLIAMFVLDSDQCFLPSFGFPEEENTLEDYIRSTENADHMKWEDITYHNQPLKIIQNTQKGIIKRILRSYKPDTSVSGGTTDKKLSSDLGQLLLPPEGFGTDPRRKKHEPKPPKVSVSSSKTSRPQFKIENTRYTPQGLSIEAVLTAGDEIKKPVSIVTSVSSETGDISVKNWDEEMYTQYPFDIRDLDIAVESLTSKKPAAWSSVEGIFKTVGGITIARLLTQDRICYGVKIDASGKKKIKLKIRMLVRTADKSLTASFSVKE